MSHIQVVQEIGMTGMLRTGIGGRFIQYFAVYYYQYVELLLDIGREVYILHALESDLHYHARYYKSRQVVCS